jgi:hypothetical protein
MAVRMSLARNSESQDHHTGGLKDDRGANVAPSVYPPQGLVRSVNCESVWS